MSVLNELDGLRDAARQAAEYRRRAASYRESADAETHPVRRDNLLAVAAEYDGQADTLEPQISRLRRAVSILERALADDA